MPPIHKGLSDAEVTERRKQYGANVLPKGEHHIIRIIRETATEPMLLLLTVAAVIYFVTGQSSEGIMMAVAIVIVSGISIYQQIRSEKAVTSLSSLTAARSKVTRNGTELWVHSQELVVDDILWIEEGNKIPADGKILQSSDLSIDESILTGESFPVEKNNAGDLIYSGSTVASGFACVKITAVGVKAKIGEMGLQMKAIRKENTPLQKQVHVFVRQMAFFGISAFIVIWLLNYLSTGNMLYGLLQGLTLAMAALPEEIPVALTTFMALGAYHLIKTKVLARQPQTVEALGAATVICVDKTGTITENRMTLDKVYVHRNSEKGITSLTDADAAELLFYSSVSSEEVPFDPMEKAILTAPGSHARELRNYTKTGEYPLSGAHPMMTHIYETVDRTRIIGAKGAPEGILDVCNISGETRTQIEKHLSQLACEGYRVLGVASSDMKGMLPELQQQIPFTFLGLIAFNDPPKQNISEVISSFRKAGIKVKLITGDYPETARYIAMKAGITDTGKLITGKELEAMSDESLSEALKTTDVFARVLPASKYRIIDLLKNQGEVVAMTGDGVNDGPALKAAHIGIAMGKRGSEVARQAASLILVDDDLGNMVTAVALGRKIYFNFKKAVRYIISIHIPLISIVTLPLLLGWKFASLFSPVHVIFMELIMGPTCSIVYENEPMEKGLMQHPPRKLRTSFFTWRELSTSILQGLVITAALLWLMQFCTVQGYTETAVRTSVFTCLVLANIFLTLTGRSEKFSILTTIRYPNKLVPAVILFTITILVLLLTWDPMTQLFKLETPQPGQFMIAAAVAVVSVLWIEFYKKFVLSRP